MKQFLALCIACVSIAPVNAQFLKKIKDKVNNAVDKKADKAAGADKEKTSIEKKEDAASSDYSDATENNEKPIFVDKAPANGKMILQLKKDDLFWGGYIQLKEQAKKAAANTTILDYVVPRVGSFYTKGEISSYAIYVEGQRKENDSLSIPVRPQFINYTVNKTPYFLSTEAKVGTPDPAAAAAAVQAKGNKPLTKEDEAEFAKTMGGQTIQATFTFKWNGKSYGPFDGSAENMFVLRSMTDGKPSEKFYGFGTEMGVTKNEKGKSQMVISGLIQTEKNVLRVKDYALTTLATTYPGGTMAFAQGGKVQTFSNGKTVTIIKIAGIADNLMNVFTADNKYYSDIYGTDSSHVVCIVKQKDVLVDDHNNLEAYIDYTTHLNYPVSITRKNLLIASNPARSVLYNHHTLYYPDGTKETIDNVGDAQIINFNGKDYIVWFEMMKNADGHQVYVCQKELK